MDIKKLIKEELNNRFKEFIKNKLRKTLNSEKLYSAIYWRDNNGFIMIELKEDGTVYCTKSFINHYCNEYIISLFNFESIIKEYIRESTENKITDFIVV